MHELLHDFSVDMDAALREVERSLDACARGDRGSLAAAFRVTHNLRGTCGFLDLGRIAALAEALEAPLGALREGRPAPAGCTASMRAAIERMRALLSEVARHGSEPPGEDAGILRSLGYRGGGDPPRAGASAPAEGWDGLPDHVARLALMFGKRAVLDLTGVESAPEAVLRRMLGPVLHMVRNALDHGIEAPEAREAAGKAPHGTIRVALSRAGEATVLAVSDDGRGLDTAAIRRRAGARGLAVEPALAELADAEIHAFILQAGFSTAMRSDGFSGRGVGMDVVAGAVSAAGGSLAIASRAGEGTTFTMTVPDLAPPAAAAA